MSVEAEDLWHVRVAPDDVKILTLEQVDDLFRLEVIDEDTQLWQEGMDEWLPLRVVAGLDDEEAPSPPPISAPPPRSPALAQTAPWPPAPAVASQRPLPPATLPPPPSIRPPVSRPPAPPSRPPAPASSWPSPIAATQPASNFPAPIGSSLPRPTRPPPPGSVPVPGSVRSQPPSARGVAQASFQPAPISFVPAVATSFTPRTRTSRVEVALIGMAMLAGLGVSLHRNGTVQGVLASAGQTSTYENLEKSLGGPGFGTPRAVEVLVAKTPAVAEAVTAVAVNTTVSPSTPAPETTPAPASETKPSEPAGGRALVAETSAPKAEKVEKRAAPVRPAAANRQSAAAPAPVRKASLKKSKGGNEYDPLNPSL